MIHPIESIWCLLVVFHLLKLLVFLYAFVWDTEQRPALLPLPYEIFRTLE